MFPFEPKVSSIKNSYEKKTSKRTFSTLAPISIWYRHDYWQASTNLVELGFRANLAKTEIYDPSAMTLYTIYGQGVISPIYVWACSVLFKLTHNLRNTNILYKYMQTHTLSLIVCRDPYRALWHIYLYCKSAINHQTKIYHHISMLSGWRTVRIGQSQRGNLIVSTCECLLPYYYYYPPNRRFNPFCETKIICVKKKF